MRGVDIEHARAELRHIASELRDIRDTVKIALERVAEALEDLGGHHEAPAAAALTTTVRGGPNMAVIISVDDTGAHADYAWTDRIGDPVPAPLDDAGGAFVVTLASDNPAVATVAQDPSVATRVDITEIALGDFNITTTIVDSTGAPGVWPTGTPEAGQPIVDPPVACSVIAGGPTGLTTVASA